MIDKDKIAQESENFAKSLVQFCESKYPDGTNESAHILMNAFIYAAATLGVATGFTPESVIQGFVTGVQEAYNATGKWKVQGAIVHSHEELNKAMKEAAQSMAFDTNEYGQLFDTGRPKTKQELN